jgi:hypothetical protein
MNMGKLQLNIKKGAFAAAKAKMEEFGEDVYLDPGQYSGKIMGARTPKADMVVIDIRENESNGRVSIIYGTAEDRLGFLLRDLRKFGLEPSDDSEVVEALDALNEAKPGVLFKVVEKNGHTNINILKVTDTGEAGEEKEVAADPKAGKVSAGAKAGSPKAEAGKKKVEAPAEEEDEEAVAEAEEESVDAEDEEAEPTVSEEEAAIEPGMKCKVKLKSGAVEKCEVTEVFEAEGKVGVKVLSGDKKNSVFKVTPDRLEA